MRDGERGGYQEMSIPCGASATHCLSLRDFDFNLPAGALVVGDKADNDYEMKAVLTTAGIHLCPFRKHNSKRPHPPHRRYLLAHYRKTVETTISRIARLLPRSIHGTSAQGFELRVVLFVLAASFNCFPILEAATWVIYLTHVPGLTRCERRRAMAYLNHALFLAVHATRPDPAPGRLRESRRCLPE